jgi:hypothetical protein
MRKLGKEKQTAFLYNHIGRTMEVLWEAARDQNEQSSVWRGHTSNYISVLAISSSGRPLQNTITPTLLTQLQSGSLQGIVLGDN